MTIKLKHFITLCLLCMITMAQAQRSAKGFDYAAHKKMNHKAARWSNQRMKAADHDPTNIQCSVRKSRRHARKSK